jgi:hypothetical protein
VQALSDLRGEPVWRSGHHYPRSSGRPRRYPQSRHRYPQAPSSRSRQERATLFSGHVPAILNSFDCECTVVFGVSKVLDERPVDPVHVVGHPTFASRSSVRRYLLTIRRLRHALAAAGEKGGASRCRSSTCWSRRVWSPSPAMSGDCVGDCRSAAVPCPCDDRRSKASCICTSAVVAGGSTTPISPVKRRGWDSNPRMT